MDDMGWLVWIIVGGLSGWLAGMMVYTRLGMVMDIIIGIMGAIIGGFLFKTMVTATNLADSDAWSMVVAFIGAAILLGLLRRVDRSSAQTY